jgi:hypothetical protein
MPNHCNKLGRTQKCCECRYLNQKLKCTFEPITEIDKLRAENEALKLSIHTRPVPGNIPPIVCLCGSTRFMDAFFEAGWKFTLMGHIVLSVGVCKHAADHGGEAWTGCC